MIKSEKRIIYYLFIILFSIIVYSQKLGKRTPFNIPLIKLRVRDDKEKPAFKKVYVVIRGKKEYAIITRLNDFYVEISRQGRKKTVYAEAPASAFALTDFEAQQVNGVIRSLISTLEIFERDIQKQRWDKCLYLDSFFPRFLKGFYYLSCAAFNSCTALPGEAKISDSMFDISLNSIKSDKRINRWQERKDYIIKLRIATRELIYQLKTWQKKKLGKSKRTLYIEYSENLKETYCLFVKMYFNIY